MLSLRLLFFMDLTAILFPIGMFPYIMIVTALIFFSGQFHQNIINRLGSLFKLPISYLIRSTKNTFLTN